MNLNGKNALIFAATGAVASGVAGAFAREGATLWLSARNRARLDALAGELRASGAQVHAHVVDALSEEAVRDYVRDVRETAGTIDATFNGIGGLAKDLRYPRRATESTLEDFMTPVSRILASQFITSREVGRVMAEQGTGSIITLSATLSGTTPAFMAGLTATCGAIEAMTRSLAGEFGPLGVRVNCLRASAMPETPVIKDTYTGMLELRGGVQQPVSPNPLRRPITVDETAKTAVFLASDASSGMTAQTITVCAGAFV